MAAFSLERRSRLLFVQLLDINKRENYVATWRCHYALNLLLMEVTCESFQISHFLNASVPAYILDVVEWIRTHYDRPLSVAYIAEQFGYHPTYLTNVFKKIYRLSDPDLYQPHPDRRLQKPARQPHAFHLRNRKYLRFLG